MTTDDEVTRYQKEEDVPAALQKKLVLLQRFTQYMDKFMTEGKYFIQFIDSVYVNFTIIIINFKYNIILYHINHANLCNLHINQCKSSLLEIFPCKCIYVYLFFEFIIFHIIYFK